MKASTIIYGIIDPYTHELRYVGKSSNIARRKVVHKYDALHTRGPKSKWLSNIYNQGDTPIFVELEAVPLGSSWEEYEMFWIAYAKFLGAELFNRTAGGLGHLFDTLQLLERSGAKQDRYRGELHKQASISEVTAISVVNRLLSGDRPVDIAADLKIEPNIVYFIAEGKTWRHIFTDIELYRAAKQEKRGKVRDKEHARAVRALQRELEALAVLNWHKTGATKTQISKALNKSLSAVSLIVSGKRFKHLSETLSR